jgi:hypothetical protein
MRILIAALALTATACTTTGGSGASTAAAERKVAPILTTADARDPHSYAQPEVARVTHVALDLGLDFEASGSAAPPRSTSSPRPGAQEIVLDTKGWKSSASPTRPAARSRSCWAVDEAKGAPLTIRMGDARGS